MSRERRKPRDEVAVLGGCSERVSVAKFPDNRENTGNFRGFGLQTGLALWFQTYKSVSYGQIPYVKEQGIFSSYQGIAFIASGKQNSAVDALRRGDPIAQSSAA